VLNDQELTELEGMVKKVSLIVDLRKMLDGGDSEGGKKDLTELSFYEDSILL